MLRSQTTVEKLFWADIMWWFFIWIYNVPTVRLAACKKIFFFFFIRRAKIVSQC
jgi:hypothetical protein